MDSYRPARSNALRRKELLTKDRHPADAMDRYRVARSPIVRRREVITTKDRPPARSPTARRRELMTTKDWRSADATPKASLDMFLPKNFTTPLTCFFWRTNGSCNKSDDDCAYAHYDTGFVADGPINLSGGKSSIRSHKLMAPINGVSAVAGRNAQTVMSLSATNDPDNTVLSDLIEQNELLKLKLKGLKGRVQSIVKREEELSRREEELRRREGEQERRMRAREEELEIRGTIVKRREEALRKRS
jgi:hypothetical protein